jgi:glycosyltransferase involved in cell wall biosynthesis
MARILFLMADLPYFPGKMGLDFFNLRHLARRHEVGVVGPWYPQLPAEGIENLRRTAHHCWFWPEPTDGEMEVRSGPRLRPFLRRWLGGRARALLAAWPGGVRDEAGLAKLRLLGNLEPYLRQALAHRDWDALVVVQSDTRSWLPFLPAHLPLAVYFHDLRCLAAEREYRVRGGRGLARRVATIRRDERELVATADAVGYVSTAEATASAQRLGDQPHAMVVPVALDLEYFQRPLGVAREDATVLFTGHLSHPPNVDAVDYLLAEVWPRVREQVPGVRLVVAGCHPAAELLARCREAGVDVEANPADMRPLLAAATVFVVPMRFGGGVRQKVLEAWAMELPVVSTPMGVEGLPARDRIDCRLAADGAGLASAVLELLADPRQRAELARAGRGQLAPHDLEVASARFEELVLAAIARRRQRGPVILLDATHVQPGEVAADRIALRVRSLLACWPAGWQLVVLASAANLDRWRFAGPAVTVLASDGWTQACRPLRAAVLELAGAASLEELAWLRALGGDLVHTTPESRLPALRRLPHVMELGQAPPPPTGRPRGWIVAARVPGLAGWVLERPEEALDAEALLELYRRALGGGSAFELDSRQPVAQSTQIAVGEELVGDEPGVGLHGQGDPSAQAGG